MSGLTEILMNVGKVLTMYITLPIICIALILLLGSEINKRK